MVRREYNDNDTTRSRTRKEEGKKDQAKRGEDAAPEGNDNNDK